LSFELLCTSKSRSILGTSVNVMDREEAALLPQDVEHAAKLRVLQKQCRGYYELSLLVKAVDALNAWRIVEHDYATYVPVCLLITTCADCEFSKVPRPTSLPARVKTTFENTCAAVEPVLSGILMHAKDGMRPLVPYDSFQN
jgi:nuclear pore complex protein Nup107